jgi:hypothetical protein
VFDLDIGTELNAEINEKVIGDFLGNFIGGSILSFIMRPHCMVRFGVVWCDLVCLSRFCGMILCGLVWSGVDWCDTVRFCMVWCYLVFLLSQFWCGVIYVWFDVVWCY